jgi:hypothetical protein
MTSPTRKSQLMRKDADRNLFIDKLAERWLVERGAVGLYDLALQLLEGKRELGDLPERLVRFRDEEKLHAEMLEQLLAEFGRHPRNEPATPGVNLGASEISSLLDVLRVGEGLQPRHVLEVLLCAELIDGGGWEILTDLAKEADLNDEWLSSFRQAVREETEHEHVLREHLLRLEREELIPAQYEG